MADKYYYLQYIFKILSNNLNSHLKKKNKFYLIRCKNRNNWSFKYELHNINIKTIVTKL